MSVNETQNDKPEETIAPVRPVKIDPDKLNLREEIITLNRCAKVVKGGRRFSFAALVCVGDGEGHVGLGFGKANEVPDAIQKAVESGKKNLQQIPLMGRSLPHQIYGVFGTARVLLKPAAPGTGLIAGTTARKVLELAGVGDVLAKSLGSKNIMNVAKATLAGLTQLERPERIARLRGKKIEDMIGRKAMVAYTESMERLNAPASSGGGKPGDGGRRKSRGNDGDRGDRRRAPSPPTLSPTPAAAPKPPVPAPPAAAAPPTVETPNETPDA